ncbi:MAG: 1-deoxy-D-xylulose-5-phosphate synthase [Lachnospiraceae bacterium]|nr:1-deoxy-D-xylulose-5-phosphate synthase [Lachnospiraceae bacterium]
MLEKINKANDIKKIAPEDYAGLAKDIRRFLLKHVSKTGGHLASNLGIVELTMALHLVLDFPKDQLIFDVGHQSYVHKILTGRKDGFEHLRQFGGMSGFPKRKESNCDAFHSGHSSMSLSTALGFAEARNLNATDETIAVVIGDGALSGGMAYEALNNMVRLREEKKNLIIILNDNSMSIAKNVGGMSFYLNKIRSNKEYVTLKDNVEQSLLKIPNIGKPITKAIKRSKNSIKQLFVPGMFFEDMGITYIGPIDGHDVPLLVDTLNRAKQLDEPIIIHVKTKKGKGYRHAVNNPTKFHGVSPFDVKSGEILSKSTHPTYTSVFSDTLIEAAKTDQKITAVTAAMPDGTGLAAFGKAYPERFFDVGIAEEHAVTFCAGMAARGLKPVFAVYSTFLQRGFDQMIHDTALGSDPVIFGIDRSGLVGADGETHQGIFDIPFLSMIPNFTVMAPINGKELKEMLLFSLAHAKGPTAIKYSRGEAETLYEDVCSEIHYGKGQVLKEGKEAVILSVGNMLSESTAAIKLLEQNGYKIGLVNPRFIKPIDTELLDELALQYSLIVTVEEGILSGGFGSMVMQYLYENGYRGRVHNIGIRDSFVEHGSIKELRKMLEIDGESIAENIAELLRE